MIVYYRIRGIDLRLLVLLLFFSLRSLIPYVSQEGPGADKYKNDCGPAVVSMLIKHYTGLSKTPNWLMEQLHIGDRYTTSGNLMSLLDPWGIESEDVSLITMDEVLDNVPVIILVNLQSLYGDQWGIHWILVTGEILGYVQYHDSLYGPHMLKSKADVGEARKWTLFPSLAVVITDTAQANYFRRMMNKLE